MKTELKKPIAGATARVMSDKLAMVVGNGLTRSLLGHAGIPIDSSSPLRWPLTTPGRANALLDDLPGLKKYLERVDPERRIPDFDIITPFISKLSARAPLPTNLPDDELDAFLDMCHYLTVAYSWLQLQLDHVPLEGWDWLLWLRRHRSRLTSLMSWNYDLVAERLLESCGLPYVYAGLNVAPVRGRGQAGRRAPVLVSKPHGSCNFAPIDELRIETADADGAPGEDVTYPRLIHVAGYDGPMQVLPTQRLYSIRQIADIVLPGESNRFNGYIGWVGRTSSAFKRDASLARELVIVGFRMASCDQPEFERAISWMKRLDRIIIAAPHINPALLELVRDRCHTVIHWPDGPFGPALRIT